MKRLLVIVIGALLLCLALLGVTVVFLAMSEGGTRVLAAQAERFLPVKLDGVSGTLWRSIRVDHATLALDGRELRIAELAVDLRLFPVLFDNRLDLTAVRAASVALVDVGERVAPDGPPVRLQLPFMPLAIELDALDLASVQILDLPELAVRGAASWTSRGLVVHALSLTGVAVDLSLTGSLGAGSRPALHAVLDWTLPETGWQGHGEIAGPVHALVVTHAVEGPYVLALTGTVDLSVPADPGVDLEVQVEDFAIEAYGFSGVGGRVRGDLGALLVDAAVVLQTPYGAPFPATVAARGPVAGPVTFEAQAEPLDGVVSTTGEFSWRQGIAVQLQGAARDLALASVLEDLEGRFGGRFTLAYTAAGFEIALMELAGELDGRPVSGRADLRGAGADWTAELIELSVGDNRVQAQGSWQAALLTVSGRVDAPALDQLGLGVDGGLLAVVDLTGQWPALEGSVQATSEALAAGGMALAGLRLDATMQDGLLGGALDVRRLETAGLVFDDLSLAPRGVLDAIDWRLSWAEGHAEGRLAYSPDDLRMYIAQLRFQALEQRIEIAGPFAVQRVAGNITSTPVCLSGAGARACIRQFDFVDGRVSTAGELEHLPVPLLATWLPVGADDEGYLEGSWQIAGAGALWSGGLALAARNLAVALPGAAEQRIELPDVEVTGTLEGDHLELSVAAANPIIDLAGTVRLAPVTLDGLLSGSVAFRATDLAWLRTFDQRLVDLGGALSLNVALSGSAREPDGEGRLALDAGHFTIENPEFSLEQITLAGQLDRTGTFEFSGSGMQRDGRVEISGSGTNLFRADRRLQAALRASGLRARDPQWEVELAPDLQLAYANGRARLTGVVTLPRADVRLNALPATVPRPSEDVIVIGRDEPAVEPLNRLRMNVRVVLGSSVSLRALGFQADLKGEVNVRRDARGQASVRGSLDITGGLLSAQGQTLMIESGLVVYSGPVGNPYIDIRAVRAIPGQTPPVKVGLHIRGNVNNLTSSVFSDPVMAETRALAFLVLGRDLDEQSEADSGQMLTAAINLGLSQSKSITAELQRITGLDELSAVAESQDSFAIVAGKRISKGIYLRYTYNTLTALSAVLISFDLTDRWRLEALSGENSAMDILYRFER